MIWVENPTIFRKHLYFYHINWCNLSSINQFITQTSLGLNFWIFLFFFPIQTPWKLTARTWINWAWKMSFGRRDLPGFKVDLAEVISWTQNSGSCTESTLTLATEGAFCDMSFGTSQHLKTSYSLHSWSNSFRESPGWLLFFNVGKWRYIYLFILYISFLKCVYL